MFEQDTDDAPSFRGLGSFTTIDSRHAQTKALYNDAQWIEALPLFEKLAVRYPEDAQVIEALGMLVMGQTAYLKQ